MKNTIVGVDLAKDVIQVCVYANSKVQSNMEMTHHEFLEWLFKTSVSGAPGTGCAGNAFSVKEFFSGW